ncbi:MAG: phosphogluconate dehydrogenase (NAD(+)-dependent, decarboxylating) [Mycobacteriales bacterium]
MQLGMIGLGKMGGNMRTRLRAAGHDVVGFDHNPDVSDADSLESLVGSLQTPRAVWVMVPAGDPTEQTITKLLDLLSAGDIVIDGGNSYYVDSVRRGAVAGERGIGYVDAGVSGGIWGLAEGYALMVGGSETAIAALQPIFDSLKPSVDGFVHSGKVGAGHYTKMVHNGIEYGLMHAYAEGFELMAKCEFDIPIQSVIESWRHGTVVRSWLLDLLAKGLSEDPGLEKVSGYSDDSGEGRWTVQEGIRLAVPLNVISSSLFARFASRQEESEAMKVIATLRNQFGGHAVKHAAAPAEVEPETGAETQAREAAESSPPSESNPAQGGATA